MLQFFTQQNMLFYTMAVICAWGVISQAVLRVLYGSLIRDAARQGVPKGKFLRQLRQRYQSLCRMRQDSLNTPVFIRRNLMEYRFLGSTLHGWKRMGQIAMMLCAALGAVGWYVSLPGAGLDGIRQNYILGTAAAEILILLSYGLMDSRYAEHSLELILQDNLENAAALCASGANANKVQNSPAFSPERDADSEVAASAIMEENVPVHKTVSLPGRKKKNGKGGKEGTVQKDKQELKQNLSRLKEGIRETAASSEAASAETRKEQNTRILKEMDPDEQERVIREVLREFLS
ncbi:MAG: hypothetical protein MRZ69_11245 [Lachnospiraceae bacterium]|nr:hypothetical protein [Lachnospiraceae bacterium]